VSHVFLFVNWAYFSESVSLPVQYVWSWFSDAAEALDIVADKTTTRLADSGTLCVCWLHPIWVLVETVCMGTYLIILVPSELIIRDSVRVNILSFYKHIIRPHRITSVSEIIGLLMSIDSVWIHLVCSISLCVHLLTFVFWFSKDLVLSQIRHYPSIWLPIFC